MFRSLHVLLTISALLLCPFNCRGGIVVRDADDEPVQRCRCCHPQGLPSEEGNAPVRKSPAVPDGDCGCTNCLCRGAILPDDHPPLDVADAMLEPPLADALASAELTTGQPRVTVGRFPSDALPSGRLIRFALRSLQI